ncbi:MAG TPA: hypothetical protein VNO33_07235, partial [Kofleriaceae bacterium]|nr:hypothetical protein [Kofleriaceae bacterium]
ALTAQRLFMREVDFETFRAITEGDVPDVRLIRPDTPTELAEVVMHALSLRPEDRYATALELGDAVAASVAGLGPPAGEREIAAFVRDRFATELSARVQLLDATGTSVTEMPTQAAGPAAIAPGDAAPLALVRPGRLPSEVSGEAETIVRGPHSSEAADAARQSIEIHWTASRKTSQVRRITTGSIPRMTPIELDRPLVEARASSDSGVRLRTGSRADPRLRTQRIRPLVPPPVTGPPRIDEEPHGPEGAAIVFVAGVFGLFILLWLLL